LPFFAPFLSFFASSREIQLLLFARKDAKDAKKGNKKKRDSRFRGNDEEN